MELLEIKQALLEKVSRMNTEIGVSFPHIADGEKYDNSKDSFWTKGFFPGMLWNVYHETGEEALRKTAEEIERQMDTILHDFYMIHHDAGFVWSLASVSNYKLTGNEESKRRALIAASHLAGRFNVKGQFIRAWNDLQNPESQGWAIIDCSMNLPLLYWASEQMGDPRFKHIAMAHADTVVKEFAKADGSTYHIVCFDPETGLRVGQHAGQGAAEESAWARGQSWIVYGMALSYRYTKQARYLRTAMAAADFFVDNLPESGLPYWDFKTEHNANTPTDTSAAACAACGLLEIAEYAPAAQAAKYKAAAERMVKAMYEKCWLGDKSEALLNGATFNYPADKGIDVSLIYGDYFFTEAVMRLTGTPEIFW